MSVAEGSRRPSEQGPTPTDPDLMRRLDEQARRMTVIERRLDALEARGRPPIVDRAAAENFQGDDLSIEQLRAIADRGVNPVETAAPIHVIVNNSTGDPAAIAEQIRVALDARDTALLKRLAAL